VPDEFLTVAEVAKLLKLNQQTVRNMIDRGELGAVRVGQRRVRIRASQLDAFLAAGESGPQPAGPDPWQEVGEAASTVVAAVRAQDRDALERAISRLTDAAQEIPQARRALSPHPTAPAQFVIGVVSSAARRLAAVIVRSRQRRGSLLLLDQPSSQRSRPIAAAEC
jgi:excisionase family DNA binding protein